jgi:hypothetical protein
MHYKPFETQNISNTVGNMDSLEIENVLRNSSFTREHFVGVYPSDGLKNLKLQNDQCVVVNLCSSKTSGCHWTAFYRDNKRKLINFDSSGFAAFELNKSIIKFENFNV